MKKIAFVATLAAFGLAACDGPAEEMGEEMDDVTEAQGEVLDEQSEVLEAQADMAADPAVEAEFDAEAEALEEQADTM